MRERDAHRCEPIDIRRFRLLVSAQMTDPMVQIIDRDEKDVGLGRRLLASALNPRWSRECENEKCEEDARHKSELKRPFLTAQRGPRKAADGLDQNGPVSERASRVSLC
jgi:hypothetical protein